MCTTLTREVGGGPQNFNGRYMLGEWLVEYNNVCYHLSSKWKRLQWDHVWWGHHDKHEEQIYIIRFFLPLAPQTTWDYDVSPGPTELHYLAKHYGKSMIIHQT